MRLRLTILGGIVTLSEEMIFITLRRRDKKRKREYEYIFYQLRYQIIVLKIISTEIELEIIFDHICFFSFIFGCECSFNKYVEIN